MRVEDLTVTVPTGGGSRAPVLRGLSFELRRGEAVGLVGESGAGKSLTSLAILRLLPAGVEQVGGKVLLAPAGAAAAGEAAAEEAGSEEAGPLDLTGLPEAGLRRVRGRRIALVFQEPRTALHPAYTVGAQVVEALRAHPDRSSTASGGRRPGRREARRRAVELLERVALPDAERRFAAYPHQLSGGQRQRVVLAMAIASRPDLLLADEPTTALDVTLQAQILDLLDDLMGRARPSPGPRPEGALESPPAPSSPSSPTSPSSGTERNLTLLLITHDLAVVAERCDRVLVMYAGQIVEEVSSLDLLEAPAHPYSQALVACMPVLPELPEPGGERPSPREREPLPSLPGRMPPPGRVPAGCAFHPRCLEAWERCRREAPPLYRLEASSEATEAAPVERRVRCFLYDPAGDHRHQGRHQGRHRGRHQGPGAGEPR